MTSKNFESIFDLKADTDSNAKIESSSTGRFCPTSLNSPILGLDEDATFDFSFIYLYIQHA